MFLRIIIKLSAIDASTRKTAHAETPVNSVPRLLKMVLNRCRLAMFVLVPYMPNSPLVIMPTAHIAHDPSTAPVSTTHASIFNHKIAIRSIWFGSVAAGPNIPEALEPADAEPVCIPCIP